LIDNPYTYVYEIAIQKERAKVTQHRLTGHTPAYEQIADEIRRDILEGRRTVGERLPKIRALSEHYNVAIGTVQHAIVLLIAEKLIHTEGKRGTFVNAIPAPGLNASSLPSNMPLARTGQNCTVSILANISMVNGRIEDNEDAFAIKIYRAAERALAREGVPVTLYNHFGKTQLTDLTRQALVSATGGFISINAYNDSSWLPCMIAETESTSLPVIYLSTDIESTPFPHIFFDQESLGYEAARHLLLAGYSRLLFLCPVSVESGRQDWVNERLTGIRTAIAQMGLPDEVLTVQPPIEGLMADQFFWEIDDTSRTEIAERYLREALAQHCVTSEEVSEFGIIAPNDNVAMRYHRFLIAAGLQPGSDIGLLGFDDTNLSSMNGISTVQQPFTEMGEMAARSVLRLWQGETLPSQMRYPATIITRASTMRSETPNLVKLQLECAPGEHPVTLWNTLSST
jgi:DNA-binding LacI/PurR family transcriptional regulator/DNA-binding transcriptional regulator YhcF (GntR family)